MKADDWPATLGESEAEHVIQELSAFRVNVQRWLNAVTLPIDQLALTLAQLTALEATSEYDGYEEGAATMRSRLGYVKERLCLLYVGITRAKKDLIETWNSGRQGDATPSLATSSPYGDV